MSKREWVGSSVLAQGSALDESGASTQVQGRHSTGLERSLASRFGGREVVVFWLLLHPP